MASKTEQKAIELGLITDGVLTHIDNAFGEFYYSEPNPEDIECIIHYQNDRIKNVFCEFPTHGQQPLSALDQFFGE